VAALDGVRGIAILAIMPFHSGIPGLDIGGYFSQDAFFVVSGLVITLILLQEWNRTHAIRPGRSSERMAGSGCLVGGLNTVENHDAAFCSTTAGT
jgi:hypothetical protein